MAIIPILNDTDLEAPLATEDGSIVTAEQQPKPKNPGSTGIIDSPISPTASESLLITEPKPDANQPKPDTPSLSETVDASLSYDNPYVAAYENAQDPFDASIDPNYDYKAGTEGTIYAQIPGVMDQLARTTNETQKQAVFARADRGLALQTTLSNADWKFRLLGGLAAGVLDPLAIVPGFSLVRGGRMAILAKNLAQQSAMGAGFMAQQEALLHSQSPVRTIEESEAAILAGAVLGGILGGLPAAARGFKIKAAKDAIELHLSDITNNIDAPPVKSVGAAKNIPRTAEETKTKPWLPNGLDKKHPELEAKVQSFVKNFLQVPFLHAPTVDGQLSTFSTVRDTVTRLFDPVFETVGIAPKPVTRKLYVDDFRLRVHVTKIRDLQAKLNARQKVTGKTPYTHSEFQVEVTRAYNRGDVHEHPEIAAVAAEWRSIIKKKTKRLLELDILSKEDAELISNGDLTRAWDLIAIRTNRKRFRRLVAASYKRQNPELTNLEAKGLADDSIDRLLGMGEDTVELMSQTRATVDRGVKFTHERTIPLKNIEAEDFIIKDFEDVATLQIRQSDRMIRVHEALQEAGHTDLNGPLKALQAEMQERGQVIDKIKDSVKRTKARAKLEKTFKKDEELLKDVLLVGLGQYHVRTKADGVLRSLRTYQFVRLMDQITLASIPDLAMPVFKFGLGKAARGWEAQLRAVSEGVENLTKRDLDALGGANDFEMNSTMRMMDPESFRSGVKSSVGKWSDWVGDKASLLFGAKWWNGYNKRMARRTASMILMDDIVKFNELSVKGNLTKAEQSALKKADANLADHALTLQDRQQILDSYLRHGGKSNETTVLGADNWDEAVQDLMIQALEKDVRGTILTPEAGDIPLLIQKTELMRTLFQFKGFIVTANSRILLAGLHRRDAAAVQGLTSLILLGAFSYIVRAKLNGQELDMSPENLILEGFMRSGSGGLIADTTGLLLPTGTVSTRLQNQNRIEYFAGPSYSVLKIINSIYGDIVSGEVDEGTAKTTTKLLPASRLIKLIKLYGDI